MAVRMSILALSLCLFAVAAMPKNSAERPGGPAPLPAKESPAPAPFPAKETPTPAPLPAKETPTPAPLPAKETPTPAPSPHAPAPSPRAPAEHLSAAAHHETTGPSPSHSEAGGPAGESPADSPNAAPMVAAAWIANAAGAAIAMFVAVAF